MLIGLDPLLGPDLLHALRAMGHGDTIVLADANFPAASVARRLIRADGSDLPSVLTAVLSVLPIDQMEPEPAVGMEVVGDPNRREPVHLDMERLLLPHTQLTLIERHAFYERARAAFAVVATGERRFYGNLILRKGTVAL
ncbi:MAG: RbsD/FucU domain-containing protein [Reyranellaceae bacterium]